MKKTWVILVVLIVLACGAFLWRLKERAESPSASGTVGSRGEAAADTAQAATIEPGGVVELVVGASGDINLDEAKVAEAFVAPPLLPAQVGDAREVNRRAQEEARWRGEHGVNMSLDLGVGYTVETDAEHREIGPRKAIAVWGLAYYNRTVLVPVSEDLWEHATAEGVARALVRSEELTAAGGYRNPMRTGVSDEMGAYAFRTGAGTLGVLRFARLEATPEPRAVVQVKRVSGQ